jgi:hypothetical protein
MHTCAYCGRRLLWFHRVVGSLRFCSREHARLHGIRAAADAEAEDGNGMPSAGGAFAWGTDSDPAAADPDLTAPPQPDDSKRGICLEFGGPADEPSGDVPADLAPQAEPTGCREEAGAGGGVIHASDERSSGREAAAAPEDPYERHVPDCRGMLPLPLPIAMAAGRPGLRGMPSRPPRRRIIVPSHRPHRKPPELLQADGIPASAFLKPLRPPAVQCGPQTAPIFPAFPAAMPALPGRSGRRTAEAGLRCETEPAVAAKGQELAPIGGGPIPPAGQPPAPRLHPLWQEGGVFPRALSAPGALRLGPAAALGALVAPLPLPAHARDRRPSLAGLIHAGIQPFRLHRSPNRLLQLPPGLKVLPEPLRVWPAPGSSSVSGLLYVPRPAAMPIRPSYSFGPPPVRAASAADAPSPKAARQGSSIPPGQMARG